MTAIVYVAGRELTLYRADNPTEGRTLLAQPAVQGAAADAKLQRNGLDPAGAAADERNNQVTHPGAEVRRGAGWIRVEEASRQPFDTGIGIRVRDREVARRA